MSLLSKKRPIVINPGLAVIVGLNEAIVLQQLAYWIEETESGVDHDGMRWIYNTHTQWQAQFPFWSADTVKRAFASLKKQGFVLVEKLAKSKHDQTNYYTVNYEAVALIDEGNLHCSEEGSLPPSVGANPSDLPTENTTESTSENTKGRKAGFDPVPQKPDSVSADAWAEWIKFRKEIRKPLTQTMCNQQAKVLDACRNPDAVILKSIANGWTGLFPDKGGPGGKPSRHHGLDKRDYGSGSDETVIIGGL